MTDIKSFCIIPENGRISAYFSKEDADYINENYLALMDSPDKVPVGQFIIKAVTTAMSVRRPDSNPLDIAELTNLKNQVKALSDENETLRLSNGANSEQIREEIQRLTSELHEKNTLVSELTLENEKLEKQFADSRLENINLLKQLNTEIEKTELLSADSKHEKTTLIKEVEQLKQKLALPDGAIIVSLTKSESTVINYVCSGETERTGQPVTPDLLLKNVFAHILMFGPHDMFKTPIGIRKLQELKELSEQS
jgi:hypothetical protein